MAPCGALAWLAQVGVACAGHLRSMLGGFWSSSLYRFAPWLCAGHDPCWTRLDSMPLLVRVGAEGESDRHPTRAITRREHVSASSRIEACVKLYARMSCRSWQDLFENPHRHRDGRRCGLQLVRKRACCGQSRGLGLIGAFSLQLASRLCWPQLAVASIGR